MGPDFLEPLATLGLIALRRIEVTAPVEAGLAERQRSAERDGEAL